MMKPHCILNSVKFHHSKANNFRNNKFVTFISWQAFEQECVNGRHQFWEAPKRISSWCLDQFNRGMKASCYCCRSYVWTISWTGEWQRTSRIDESNA